MFFTVIGLVGGFFTGLYTLDSYPTDMKQLLIDELSESGITQIPIEIFIAVVTAVQSASYGLILGAIGIFLGKKTDLWKDEKSITKKPLIASASVAVIGGLAMILLDIFFFGRYSQMIMESYAVKPSVTYMLAAVFYGGVIEEVMLRLFFMSLVAFVLYKLFERKKDKPSDTILIIANIFAAILFASGHLPATFTLIGNSPMIIARCFLLNGGIGLLFGRLYRKYGLRYSMIAHGGCHIISKLIWILFI